jgi:hypothetical protein
MTGEIAEHLLPVRRLRAFPRVVKRKMSSFGVKRAKHRAWPRPTLPAGQAIVVVGASKPAPIRRLRRASPSHPDDNADDAEPAEAT